MSRKYYVVEGNKLTKEGCIYTYNNNKVYGTFLRYPPLLWVSLEHIRDKFTLCEVPDEEVVLFIIRTGINLEFNDEM